MRFPIGIPIIIRNVRINGPNGSVKIDMLLDTGAAYTALSWTDLKAIGYDPAVAPDRQEVITANGVLEVPKLKIKCISISNIEVRDIEVICHDIPELAGIRGLIGLSFIKHFRTVVDYKEGYIEII